MLLLFALGIISREQVAEAIGATVDAVSGILDQLQKGLISIGAAIAGIMQSVAGDDGETEENDKDAEDSQPDVDERYDGPNAIPNDSTTSGHIFRDAPGHLKEDTPENRGEIEDVANDPEYYLDKDQYGNEWYQRDNPDGTSTWAETNGDGRIFEGGRGEHRPFDPRSGLKSPDRPW